MNMENINDKERLIFYKRETPYFSESSVTETQNYTNVWIKDDEPTTTSAITENESGNTVIVETEYDAVSGISSVTTTTQVMVPDDITKNCKLTMQDLDENFLTLKDYDIKSGYYDLVSNTIHLQRNNSGLTDIVIELSGITTDTQSEPSEETEPGEDTEATTNSFVNASLSGDSIVILNWIDSDGTSHEVFVPTYKEEKHLNATSQTPHIDKAVTKKPILGIINSIDDAEKVYGNRYILIKKASVRGYLYPNDIIVQINEKLSSEALIWRVSDMSDFNTLFDNQECVGGNRGLVLKASGDTSPDEENGLHIDDLVPELSTWDGWDNFGFHALPTEIEEEEEIKTCSFATVDGKFIELRTGEDDIISGDTNDSTQYSLRLVADVSSTTLDLSDSIVNILGDDYRVKKIGSQYWITSNLNYSIDNAEPRGDLHPYLIQYDGQEWEQKQLSLGTSVWMQDVDDFINEYLVLRDEMGFYLHPRFDAGWY